jgi:RNA polymerase sigma-70 factor, ECF subfamily
MNSRISTLDDATLVEMAQAGQGDCFGELMLRHKNMVRARVVSIVRNSADVDDVVQDVFFKAWRALSTFRADATFRTWLASIATNEALMLYRREQRQRRYEIPDSVDAVACHVEPADKAAIRNEAARAIHGAIGKLPAKYREVITLCDIEELTTPMTAKRLKATVPAVKTRVFRGRLKLAMALRGWRKEILFHAA